MLATFGSNTSLIRATQLLLMVGLATASLHAQGPGCFTATGNPEPLFADVPNYPANDEGKTAEMSLGFTFPMAGVGYAITHCVVDSNGEVYLTDGNGVVNPSNFGTSALQTLRGGAGGSARVMAMGGDNAGEQLTSQILVDKSVPSQCKITWVDWSSFGANQDWDCSVTLCAGGTIQFDYSQGFTGLNIWDYVGVSIGNAVGSAFVSPQNLHAGGDSGALGLVYENTWPPFDLEHSSVSFSPNGTGGFSFARTCMLAAANHQVYGTGCYDVPRQCVYEAFALPSSMAAALQGTALLFTPSASADGYVVTNSSATYVVPSAAASNLMLGDEAEANLTPSQPFPHQGNVIATMSVSSNGFVTLGPMGSNLVGVHGSVFDMVHSPVASFRSNADLDPGASGAVLTEEIGNVLYVSWHDVVRFGSASPERIQMQFDLSTGAVVMVWDQLATGAGGPSIVGYAPGDSQDPGTTDLSAAMPLVTAPDVFAMAMTASPPPVSNSQSGTVVVYHIGNIPDANVNSGVYFGITILSLFPMLPSVDLGFFGMPGCRLHVATMDITVPFVGTQPNQTTALPLPAAIPAGVQLFAQSVALVFPNSLPNGQNAFGAVTSNGVRSFINTF
ncbi:MAG: hypothetical protein ACI89X_004375 [Planctomycetota bacterium]|jgi:hypothetical protein